MDESNTSCYKFLKKYLPVSEDNAHGVIPLLGLIASLFTAVLYLQRVTRNTYYIGLSLVWFCLGMFIFAALQCFWGFHANRVEMLQLWIKSKWAELLLIIILCVAPYSGNALFGTFHLVFVSILLHVGRVKYKHLKKIAEKNASVDGQPFCYK